MSFFRRGEFSKTKVTRAVSEFLALVLLKFFGNKSYKDSCFKSFFSLGEFFENTHIMVLFSDFSQIIKGS